KSLLGAFKATLEELQDADLLLHIVDCTSPRLVEQIHEVEAILDELGLGDKERILLFNKSDLLDKMKREDPLAFMKARHTSKTLGAFYITATDKRSLTPLIDQLQQRFWE